MRIQLLLQHGGGLAQQGVTGRMAAGVVDGLELVQVQIHQGIMFTVGCGQ